MSQSADNPKRGIIGAAGALLLIGLWAVGTDGLSLVLVAVIYTCVFGFTGRVTMQSARIMRLSVLNCVTSLAVYSAIWGSGISGMITLGAVILTELSWNVSFFPWPYSSFYGVIVGAFFGAGVGLLTGACYGFLFAPRTSESLRLITELKQHARWVSSVAFSPDSSQLATASYDETIRLWELNSSQTLHTISTPPHAPQAVQFSPHGQHLAAAVGQEIQIWSLPTGEHLRTLAGHTAKVWALAYLGDGTELISVADDGTWRRWETGSGTCLDVLQRDQEETTNHHTIHAVACAPDGRRWATADREGVISTWQVGVPKPLHTLTGHVGKVLDLATSADGRWLASAGDDQTVRLWRWEDGFALRIFHGHTAAVSAVSFSAEGPFLASASADGMIILWELPQGSILLSRLAHQAGINSLRFSPCGTLLATCSGDATVCVWAAALKWITHF